MTLGENIKNRREELKLSQEYVAEQLGVSRQAVSKWETGQSEPTASNLIQLAEVFDINLSELVDPHKNVEDGLTAEKGRDRKKPNLILRANLIKIAIIAQVAFMFNCTSVVYQLRHPDYPNKELYYGALIFSLICCYSVPYGWQQTTAMKRIKSSAVKMQISSWATAAFNF